MTDKTEPPGSASSSPDEVLCRNCGHDGGDTWFDRSVCAQPCSSMHDRCSNCGSSTAPCPHERLSVPRRPPYTVAYAVEGGHAYEIALPGDASVIAEDGVLKISHPSAVLALTQVQPFTTEQ